MRAYRIAACALLGLAIFAVFNALAPPAGAQDDAWVEVGRGRNYIEYQRGDQSKQEIFGGPVFTLADNGDWVPYIFEDLGDRYCVKYPHASVQFFDYYSTTWTENWENVVIYDDRWTVEYLNRQGRWTDSSFWNIVRSYEVGDDWISIFRTGDTVIGQRVENYTFRQGAPVKIKIGQTCDDAETVRFVWKPSGIVADAEAIHIENYKNAGLIYYDADNNWMGSLAWSNELEILDNVSVTVDEHAQGRKATVTFENFEVGTGGTAVLDPTETFYSATSDGYIRVVSSVSYSVAHDASSGTPSTGHNNLQIGQILSGGIYRIHRAFVFFDTSHLPNSATIVDATLSLYKHYDGSAQDFDVVVQNGQPTYPHEPLESGDYENTHYLDNGGSFNTSTFTSGYNDIALNENARENWIRKDNMTKLCLKSSRDIDNIAPADGVNEYIYVRSSEYAGCQPRLTITWTTPLPQPYNLKVEGEDSPQRLTTLTPTFSFTYYSENGDNMENFRIQVGTSAGDNSLWDQTTAQENENNDNITITYAGTALSRGTQYFWRVRVQDNNSTWGNFSDNENFRINQPPTCSITTPTSGADYDVDKGIGFTSSASDNDGDTLTYSWNFGDLLGTSALANPPYSYGTSGDYTVTLYVSDGYENSATDSIIVNIDGGALPEDGEAPPPGDGGGPSGGISIPTPKEIVDTVIEPEKNILFVRLFSFGPLVINPFIGLVAIAIISKYKKQKGIFLTCVMLLGFLIFFGSRLV